MELESALPCSDSPPLYPTGTMSARYAVQPLPQHHTSRLAVFVLSSIPPSETAYVMLLPPLSYFTALILLSLPTPNNLCDWYIENLGTNHTVYLKAVSDGRRIYKCALSNLQLLVTHPDFITVWRWLVFWFVMPCSLEEVYQRFGDVSCLPLSGQSQVPLKPAYTTQQPRR